MNGHGRLVVLQSHRIRILSLSFKSLQDFRTINLKLRSSRGRRTEKVLSSVSSPNMASTEAFIRDSKSSPCSFTTIARTFGKMSIWSMMRASSAVFQVYMVVVGLKIDDWPKPIHAVIDHKPNDAKPLTLPTRFTHSTASEINMISSSAVRLRLPIEFNYVGCG